MPAEDDYTKFSTIADELFGEDEADDKGVFIDTAMERKGYKKTHIWSDPEPEAPPEKERRPVIAPRKATAPGAKKPGAGQYSE